MTQAKGARAKVVIDFESVYNTDPETPAGKILNINSSNLSGSQSLNTAGTIRGNRNPAEPFRGNTSVGGATVVPVDLIGIGYILKALFGAPTTTNASADYTHVFKPGDEQPSLVVEQQFPDIGVYAKYNGCKASRFSISVGGDGELTASLDWLGAKETISSSAYDESATAIALVRFGNFQASLEEGGSLLAIATSVDLTIDMGLDGDTYVIGGQGFRGAINEGIIGISGTVRALFQNNTLLNKAVNGTPTSLKITFTKAANKALEIFLPEVVYERKTPGIEGPRGILIELPFQAYYSSNGDNTAIKTTLKNQIASYA